MQYSVEKRGTPMGAIEKYMNIRISFSLKMSTLLILIVVIGALVSLFVRYRVTTKYSRLSRELDQDGKDEDDLLSKMWNETPDSDSDSLIAEKVTSSSHFDEFLKAIKVFGFLEHDVFNELTRSTRTLRVNKDERVHLKELEGFAVVISGAMKVYCESDHTAGEYDLLNEITVPAPISSLSSILSLFSDTGIDSDHGDHIASVFEKVNATVVAEASEPSTIVVIPAEAFRQLALKFPHATANIVQIILFRWSQVTFRTCQRYLNLTQQFYNTERSLNATAKRKNQMPHRLVEKTVKQLKALAVEVNSEENVVELKSSAFKKGINPRFGSLGQVSSSMFTDIKSNGSGHANNENVKKGTNSAESSPIKFNHIDFSERSHNVYLGSEEYRYSPEFPGDLLSHAPLKFDTSDLFEPSLNGSFVNLPDQVKKSGPKQNSWDSEENALRREIVDIMFATIMSSHSVNHDRSRENLNESKFSGDTRSKSQIKEDQSSTLKNKDFVTNNQRNTTTNSDERIATPSYGEVLSDASDMLELVWYRQGEYISRYNQRPRGLIYVLDGCLEVGHHPCFVSSENEKYERLFDVTSGDITGFLETVSSYTSFVDLIAKQDTCVAIISKSTFDRLADVYPLLYISAAKTLTSSLTRPMVQLDFSLEWISIKAGGRLLKEGSNANAIYFVLNGRLRAYQGKKLIGDIGHNSTIGELETMSGQPNFATMVAVRDTELSRFPRTLVECLARQYPLITFEMSRMVVQAMKARNSLMEKETLFSDFKTLALLPTISSIPIEEFAIKLSSAFKMIGKEVKIITSAVILRYLGKYAFHKLGILKLKAYLADLEDQYDILLYVADGATISQWMRTCVDQADCILFIADGDAPPAFSDIERLVIKTPNNSQAHLFLVLLHNEKQVKHGSTAKWLKHRPWISAHYHIQMEFANNEDSTAQNSHFSAGPNSKNRVQQKFNQIKSRVQDEIKLLQHRRFRRMYRERTLEGRTAHLQYKDDFNRLARILAGEAVGLVLGGGGARGLSHIGVVQALEDAGVPIDLIGGTSIGSLIGGLYAQDYDIVPLLRKSKQFSNRASSFWRMLMDITYPMTAWTTGHAFNRAVWKCLGDSRIEDFWVQYFTNTTNLSSSKMEVHKRGYAWRYIRASMSLAGLLPPMEEKGNMLLDGGYVDNLPVMEMKKMGARHIIAVDVGAVDDTTPLKYGDTLSGFWALINKYNPLSSTPNVPNIAEIQQRLTYVSSVKALEEAKVADGVIYMRPPIDNYATLDFAKFDEIRSVGFSYGVQEVKKLIADKKLPTIKTKSSNRETRLKYRRYSF